MAYPSTREVGAEGLIERTRQAWTTQQDSVSSKSEHQQKQKGNQCEVLFSTTYSEN